MMFKNIKQFPNIHYKINVPLTFIPKKIEEWTNEKLEINPDFQRGHVWNENQQIQYIEYLLKNPTSGKEIYFNHPNWMGTYKGDFVLVDGLQRLTSVLKFLDNKIPIYNTYYKNYKDKLPISIDLIFNIATLKTRKEVLQWYIDFNTGGIIHNKEEINKVRQLLKTVKFSEGSVKKGGINEKPSSPRPSAPKGQGLILKGVINGKITIHN